MGNLQRATEPVDAILNLGKVAGVVGFEPTVHATKKRCLTAWLHPISEALDTMKGRAVQAPKWEKVVFILLLLSQAKTKG